MTTTATRPVRLSRDDQRHRLTAVTGMAGLGLDAIASVAYGPEAIVLVLAAAGSAGLGWTLPVTLAIVVLLGVLIACYRQVIQAFPDGGGAYTVATRYLGRRAGLVAGASLVVDYVLNVAVSVAAGVAALTSAFPALLPWTTELCVLVLVIVTGVNLRGIVVGAKAFALPAAVFVASVLVVIVVGLFRPEATTPASPSTTVGGVGALLVLAAFGNGCSALTGVEAIANATPSFRTPRRLRARRAEAGLGLVLGVLLIGLAVLIQRFDVRPVAGRTILSLVSEGSVGEGWLYVVIQLSTVLLLALAANTSFGGLPVLAAKLARDDYLPHVFGLRADRLVHRHGVLVLAVLAGALLIGTEGRVDVLVPLFAIGVFVGFALAQIGMVRHWRAERGRGWVPKAVLNGFGAVLTIAALIDVTASKFLEGAWLVVLVIPIFVVLFGIVRRAYARIGRDIGVGTLPARPRRTSSVVVVPVVAITKLTAECLSTALSMGDRVVAVHVSFDDEQEKARRFQADWQEWRPEVPLVLLDSKHRVLGPPVARYVKSLSDEHVVVLIGEIEPAALWERMLRNRRGAVVARCVGRNTSAVVCRLRFRLSFSNGV
ncbi:APC family permease [Kutzneria chonburiensis]|uniref:APC family permease n=1 Tax=Kutzneria chonburiensis TaxID=1483604 RepID=A0ABV6N2I5_9PSEU|nr:APC family permease [Kutzneria chonburiensis]